MPTPKQIEEEEKRRLQEQQAAQQEQTADASQSVPPVPSQPGTVQPVAEIPATPTPAPEQPQATPVVTPSEDPSRQILADAYKQQNQTFADIVASYNEELRREQEQADALQKAQIKAARWTGAGELAASMINLFGTANGAVSQTYHPYSQTWMQKAEEEYKTRRNRIDDIRNKQRSLQAQMAQMRTEEALNLIKYDQAREDRNLEIAYNNARVEVTKAQANYYAARTEAEKEEAKQKADEAEKKLLYLEAQIEAQKALGRQRDASAAAATTRAAAASDEAGNRNRNRDLRTQSQIAYDTARSQAALRKAAGLNQTITIPQIGVQTPATPAPATAADDNNTAPFILRRRQQQ